MRTIGVDLGSRRVGIALSDSGGGWATPYQVLTISTAEQAHDQVLAIIRREGAERLVVGVPLNMDGTIGPAAQDAARWARALAQAVGIPLILVDERLSSFEAEQQLNDRRRSGEKLTRKMKKKQLDAIAATTFLQAFLDGKLAPLDL